ncbi:MAG: hypothetical protein IPM31_11180 [Anaerolineae bacterium]|nr:hypothetical protein [Anaerolineae bacterium]MBL8104015.1 hypothetical protein [Anaerolineales bacterium]MCC7190780.1 hypothetical protein [Anaerolineales bacterium]
MPSASLSLAILEALTYSDIFAYPLRFDELHRYLPIRANAEELSVALDSMRGQVEQQDGFHFLAGRDEIVDTRKARETRSRKLLPIALRYGRILGSLPFVRMVALTGSLAVLNISKNADFDYMLVTAKGRVWTARAFALLFNRLVRPFGHTICPNLIVSESALEWHLHDLYSARELVQMIPISGMDVYQEVMDVNSWVTEFVPQSSLCGSRAKTATDPRGALRGVATTIKRFLQFPLRGKLGDYFESWEMTRKIARFSHQPGFGEETIFTAEVCQGNFHHHRKWTHEIFLQKLGKLGDSSPLPLGEGIGVRVV